MADTPGTPDQNSSQQQPVVPGPASQNPTNITPGSNAITPHIEQVKKKWGGFAPLAPGTRGAIPSSNTLSKRLTSMQRKPLPPLRTPRPR